MRLPGAGLHRRPTHREALVITQRSAILLFDDYALKGFNVGDMSPAVPFRDLPLRRGVRLP